MNNAFHIREAKPADIPAIIDLERATASAAHWTPEQYQNLFAANQGGLLRVSLVAESEAVAELHESPPLRGFLVARHVTAEWEIENIVVAEVARRNGVGSALINAFLERARQTDADCVFLEVRESNVAARRLYEKAGFQTSGRRKSYYANPLEDAVLYRLELG